jgi:hypothetical protein
MIQDAEGIDHEYSCIPFAFDEALDLKLQLLELVAEPLGRLLGGAAGGGDEELEIDMSAVGEALAAIPQAIATRGGAQLVARVLRNTRRMDPDTNKWRPLRQPEERTAAYMPANMGECYRAIMWVLRVNYGPFSMDALTSSKGPLGWLSSMLPPEEEPT